MTSTQYLPGEVAQRAREIYERDIRAKVEQDNKGKYLVIDIESGKYEVGENDIAVMKRAAEKYPEGTLFIMRIGHKAMGFIGLCPPGIKP